MKNELTILRVFAVLSALSLAATYICFRAGVIAFAGAQSAAPAPNTDRNLLPGSKAPYPAFVVEPQQTNAASSPIKLETPVVETVVDRAMLAGSKSAAIFVPESPKSANPVVTNPQQNDRTLLPGSKYDQVFTPPTPAPEPPKALPQTQPEQKAQQKQTEKSRQMIYGSKSGKIFEPNP